MFNQGTIAQSGEYNHDYRIADSVRKQLALEERLLKLKSDIQNVNQMEELLKNNQDKEDYCYLMAKQRNDQKYRDIVQLVCALEKMKPAYSYQDILGSIDGIKNRNMLNDILVSQAVRKGLKQSDLTQKNLSQMDQENQLQTMQEIDQIRKEREIKAEQEVMAKRKSLEEMAFVESVNFQRGVVGPQQLFF